MRTPQEQADAPARDGGPGVSWARASGGDFTTASLRVNASAADPETQPRLPRDSQVNNLLHAYSS